MLFDERPKTRRADLFNMDREFELLASAVKRGDPLTVIVGLRRTGKTSLLLTVLNEMGIPNMVIDLRMLGSRAFATRKELTELIEFTINNFLEKQKGSGRRLLEKLKTVAGVEVMGMGVQLSWGGKTPFNIPNFFDRLDEWAFQAGQRVVVAFDEAQELRKIAGLDMTKVLAHVYDYCRNILIVVTGSAIGLVYHFIGTENPKAPLYGRGRTEIFLNRLSNVAAEDFLKRGFNEANMVYSSALVHEATQKLDGVIGWLTLFGSVCFKEKEISSRAIDRVIAVGRETVRQELENFFKGREIARRRYEAIIRCLSRGPATWSEIKNTLQTHEGRPINDRNVTELINNLVKAGFVDRANESYVLPDPMLSYAFKARKRV